MTRSRDWTLVAALAFVLAVTGRVWPDGRKEAAAPKGSQQVKVYALGNLASRADDPAIGTWLAKTIPQVIEPGSWSSDGGAGTLSYYPQGKILVVSHEAGVQDKVRAFLDNLKAELPREPKAAAKDKSPSAKPVIIPARLSSPDQDPTLPTMDPAFQPQFISEPARHYGHLLLEGISFKENTFKLKKFSIMYRGEGLIDDTLAKLIKSLNKQSPTLVSPDKSEPAPEPTKSLAPSVKPNTPRPAETPANEPEDDEPTIGSRSPSSDKVESIPAPKKARRPAPTSKATKSTFVQSRYAPAPRLAAPERPTVQVILPEEAKHYAHLVVEGLSYSEKGVDLKKLSVVYRGDGIIDSNVAKVIKVLQGNMPVFGMDGCALPQPMNVPKPAQYIAPSRKAQPGSREKDLPGFAY